MTPCAVTVLASREPVPSRFPAVCLGSSADSAGRNQGEHLALPFLGRYFRSSPRKPLLRAKAESFVFDFCAAARFSGRGTGVCHLGSVVRCFLRRNAGRPARRGHSLCRHGEAGAPVVLRGLACVCGARFSSCAPRRRFCGSASRPSSLVTVSQQSSSSRDLILIAKTALQRSSWLGEA